MENLDNFLPNSNLLDEDLFEQLDSQLENPKVCNVGIIGENGSGKSSFIQSFFNWRENKRNDYDYIIRLKNLKTKDSFTYDVKQDKKTFYLKNKKTGDCFNYKLKVKTDDLKSEKNIIFITLANLGNCCKNTSEMLENCIIKQLFLSTKNENIPFLLKNKSLNLINTEKKSKTIVCLLICLLICIFSFSLYKNGESIIDYYIFFQKCDFFKIFVKLDFKILNLFIFIGSVLFFFIFQRKSLISLLTSLLSSFSKVKIGESEFTAESKKSPLNDRICDIIYFFERTKCNIVVFEDIDRFKNKKIFLHLRELNHILNNYPHIKKSIKFIYAVNDNIFVNEDKVKFFDVLIPIIPHCDSFNVGNLLISIKNKEENLNKGLYINLSNELLIRIGTYIKDTRLLLNILNEYKVFAHKLENNPDLNFSQLFSLIALKNFDNRSFRDLEYKKGFVKDVFDLRKKIIEKIRPALLKSSFENDEKETKVNNAITADIHHFSIKYLEEYIKEYPDIENVNQNLIDFLSSDGEDFIDSIISGKKVNLRDSENDSDYYVQISKTDFDKIKINSVNFETQMNEIFDNYNDELYDITKKREEICTDFNILYYAPFFELVKKYKKEYDEILVESVIDIKKNEKLYNFILDGIITEQYSSCISYFYEGELSYNDQLFINSVKTGFALNKALKLKNIGAILRYLTISAEWHSQLLTNEAVLNNDLFIYLCNSYPENHKEALKNLLEFIVSSKNIQFVMDNLDNENNEKILNAIGKVYPALLDLILDSHSQNEKINFLIDLLNILRPDVIFNLRNSKVIYMIKNNISNIKTNLQTTSKYFDRNLQIINNLS